MARTTGLVSQVLDKSRTQESFTRFVMAFRTNPGQHVQAYTAAVVFDQNREGIS